MASPATQPITASDADPIIVVVETAERNMKNFLEVCACKGDWERAKNIIDGDTELKKEVTSALLGIEILDCARGCGQWEFFNMVLQLTNPQTLAILYDNCETILHRVARVSGSMKSAKALVEKCPSLTQIPNSEGFTPLYTAIYVSKDSDLVWYLTLVTIKEVPRLHFTDHGAGDLLYSLLAADITLFILQEHPYLAETLLTAKTSSFAIGRPTLLPLASKPQDFPSGTTLGWLGRRICSSIYVNVDHIQPPSHVLQQLCGYSLSRTNPQPEMRIVTQQSKTFVPAEVGHFNSPSHVQELGVCSSSSSTKHQLELQQSETFPALKRIRDTKFKHECAIKVVNIACERTNWSVTSRYDSDYPRILSILETATTFGIFEILCAWMKFFPKPLPSWASEQLLRAAIENRQDKVLNFFLRKPTMLDVDVFKQNGGDILYRITEWRYCPKITSTVGAVFQMQKELQWFKRIEKLVSPSAEQQINYIGETPWDIFKQKHETMQKEGEKWMKDTANSCIVVAALLATVVFAAAFTVPGGNNQDTGTPLFLQNNIFMVFATFDALALFSSINSLWMFLSIITTHFALEDFHRTLPIKLIFGLATLLFAIVCTIITFCAALSLVLGHRLNELVVALIGLMAFISVAVFAILELPLFFEMVRSTCCFRLLGS